MTHTLVTGGSRGIGAAIRRRLIADGGSVSFTSASTGVAAHARERSYLTPDVRAVDWDALLDDAEAALGPVDALVNNAGIIGVLAPFVETDPATVREVFDVNVHAAFELSQAAVRRWIVRGTGGVIVNLSSIAATTGAPGEYVGYAASKAAVEAMTRGLGKELAPHGIRVVAVSPGTTRTDIHVPGRVERVAARVPMGRVAEPEEIAAAVVGALSPAASYVSGTTISVAGAAG